MFRFVIGPGFVCNPSKRKLTKEEKIRQRIYNMQNQNMVVRKQNKLLPKVTLVKVNLRDPREFD